MGNGTEEALNAEVVRRWYEIAGGGDLDALHEILATDTVDHVSGQTGVEWWKRILGAARACIDAEPGELDDLICSGDRVVARFTVRGRYRAATLPMLQGTEPAGQSVEWEHVHLFRLVEGRIAEHWAVRDDLGLLRQISGGRGAGRTTARRRRHTEPKYLTRRHTERPAPMARTGETLVPRSWTIREPRFRSEALASVSARKPETPARDETRSSRSALSSCPLILGSGRVRAPTGARIPERERRAGAMFSERTRGQRPCVRRNERMLGLPARFT